MNSCIFSVKIVQRPYKVRKTANELFVMGAIICNLHKNAVKDQSLFGKKMSHIHEKTVSNIESVEMSENTFKTDNGIQEQKANLTTVSSESLNDGLAQTEESINSIGCASLSCKSFKADMSDSIQTPTILSGQEEEIETLPFTQVSQSNVIILSSKYAMHIRETERTLLDHGHISNGKKSHPLSPNEIKSQHRFESVETCGDCTMISDVARNNSKEHLLDKLASFSIGNAVERIGDHNCADYQSINTECNAKKETLGKTTLPEFSDKDLMTASIEHILQNNFPSHADVTEAFVNTNNMQYFSQSPDLNVNNVQLHRLRRTSGITLADILETPDECH